MNSPADVLRQLLIDLSVGSSADAWPIYVGHIPDQPDEAICIYDTESLMDGRIMSSGERVSHPGFQIRVRGLVYPTTWSKANEIALALDSQLRSVVAIDSNEFIIQNITRLGDPVSLGLEDDDRRRYHFTLNAITTIRERV